jgi:GntR family transcriptional regulator
MIMLDALDPAIIKRNTPVPYHYQLSELLRLEIESGNWKVGEQIPVEEDLCAYFSLSRTTVRKSLDALVNLGLVRREQGCGTFVSEPKMVEELVNRPIGFYDDMTERGFEVVTQVLELHRITPTPVVARELQLLPGDTVIEIRRVRIILDSPVVVVSSYVPYDMCPSLLEADLTHTGLYKFLRENGAYKTDRAKSFVEAVSADEIEAQLLKVKVGSPLLMIESTVYLADGRPIDYYKSRHRGDRMRLIMESERLELTHMEAKIREHF